MMFTNGLKITLNSIISTQKYSQNVYENTVTGENYEKYPITNSYLGWARIFKTGRLPTFLVVLWIQEMMLIQCIMRK